MRGLSIKARRASAQWKGSALIVLAAAVLAGPAMAAATPVAETELPAGTTPLSAAELYTLYHDKSWQWADGAGRMDSVDRRFTGWVDGDKGKSWAEGRWLITDSGRMCLKANWHSDQGVVPAQTCFAHRAGDGTIYQKKEPDGGWYVFRHVEGRDDDEARKLVSADLVSGRLDELKPARRPSQPAAKQQAKK